MAQPMLSSGIVRARSQGRGAVVVVVALGVVGAAAATFALWGGAPRPEAERSAATGDETHAGRAYAPNAVVPAAPPASPAPVVERDEPGDEPGDEPASVDRVAALRRGLASDDVAERIKAVETVVSVTAVETLDELVRFDLPGDPEAAPTVIHAVALLGASAEGDRRDEAAKALAGWLQKERGREGADALGNTSNLVEALGNVGGKDAVEALTASLDRQELPLHMETLAVIKLGELGDPSARGAVERFAARVAELPPADGLEEELRVEAIEAAHTTLTKL